MQVTIQPSVISGAIQAPASKSSMQRGCAAALLRKGGSIIRNPGRSNDDKAAMDVIRSLGASIRDNGDHLLIESNGVNPIEKQINCGESGLGIRMFTPIAALSEKEIIITGKGSLVTRPMDFFDEILPKLGVAIKSKEGKLPLIIKGPLQPRTIEVDGSLSSQFLTGLLMAFSASDANDASLIVKNLKSRPYVDLTLDVMKQFGMNVPINKNYEEFAFTNRMTTDSPSFPQKREPTPDYIVEGDWSGGAFLLVAAAIAGEALVIGLHNTSTQADKKIVDALLDAGAEMDVRDDRIHIKRKNLEEFEFDATDCPDLFPPLVALAAHCNGVTRIRGLKRLKHKESDRGATLKEEFDKLGTEIQLRDDEMLVYGNGGVQVKNHILNSHHDHRIAMACAVAALGADFEVQIRNADAVNKSYPDFYKHLQQLGVHLSINNQIINQ